MKMKSGIKLCNRKKTAIIYDQVNGNGEIVQQYIGDGSSLYPMSGMPMLDVVNIPTLFGIKRKDIDQWDIERDVIPEEYSVKDVELGEVVAGFTGLTVDAAGTKVMAIQAEGRFFWIDAAYIEPVEADQMFLFLRRSKSGGRYIAIKQGLELGGIVTAYPQSSWVEDTIRKVVSLMPALQIDE